MAARFGSTWLLASSLWLAASCGANSLEPPEVPDRLEPGTTLTVNPVIKLLDDSHFSYVNEETKSAFTASVQQGTYSYERHGDVGRLTLNGKGADDGKHLSKLPATLELTFISDQELSISIEGDVYRATIDQAD
jgi:hypothetical protein